MEILDNIIIQDLFLYLKKHRAFVIADIHIGYEHALLREGFLVPKHFFRDFLVRLEHALHACKKQGLERVIINGDLVHDFGTLSRSARQQLTQFFTLLRKFGEIIVISGNHDAILTAILDDMPMHDEYIIGDILITHGERITPSCSNTAIKTIIIGHEHPAITLSSGIRTEKFKCFLKGRYARKNLIVMPSAHLGSFGTDILSARLLSPFLPASTVRNCIVFIVADTIYNFGTVRRLQSLRAE